MKAGRILTLLLVAFAAVTFAGCTSYVRVDYLFPPNQPIPKHIVNLAIQSPKDYPGQQGSGERVRLELSSQLRKAPVPKFASNTSWKPYVMVERDDVRQLLDEKDFSQSGFAEATEGSEQLLAGVNAFVTGSITDMRTNVQKIMKDKPFTRIETYWGRDFRGKRAQLTRVVTYYKKVPYFMLRGQFGIAFKMVDLGRGIVVAELAKTIPISLDQWESAPSAGAAMDAAVKIAVLNFVAEIAPTIRPVMHEVDSGGSAGGFKAIGDQMPDAARKIFERQLQQPNMANNAGAHYGLAIALGAMGMFEEGMKEAEEAYMIRQDGKFAQLKVHLQNLLDAWEKYEQRLE